MSTENVIFIGVAIYMLGMLGVGYYACLLYTSDAADDRPRV